MRKVRIAQIGTSRFSHGLYIFESLKNQPDIFEIAGYALPENEREKFPGQTGCFDGYREMTVDEILNDPTIEAVAVETEEKYLTKYAKTAAEHGKHVHMEKPGGLSLDDFEGLIGKMKKSGKVFHTGYMYRCNPAVREVLRQVRSGELGEIISVEAQMNCSEPADLRKWLSEFPGGMMFFLGCHVVDLVFSIMGKPDRVIPYNRRTGKDGIGSEDFGMALFEYKNGISIVKANASEVGGFARRQLVVVGTKATVELKPLEIFTDSGTVTDVSIYRKADDWWDPGEKSRSGNFGRYDVMMKEFAEFVAGEAVNQYTYDYELELYRTLLECCGVGSEGEGEKQ